MTGRLYRTTLALCLMAITALAPVAPALAQQQAAQPSSPQAGQTAAPQPGGTPVAVQVQSPVPARTIRVSDQDYTHGLPWLFPNPFAPYIPISIPEPVLTNSPRIDQMIQNGMLQISLQDAIDLALQNNLDITIQRYGPWIAEGNILNTMGGGLSRGTFAASGNFPAISFDPQFSATMSLDARTIPVNNPLTAGTGAGTGPATNFTSLSTHTAIGNLLYSQGFHTGTSFTAGFNNTRASTSSAANFFSPSITSSFVFAVNQPLLNGFGLLVNERNIRIARLNKNYSDQLFRQQVITSITAVGNAYWELVYARGNVDVNKESVTLAQKLYSDNQKQVEIGTLAPLEVIRAEAQLASAQQGLIAAQTVQLQDENQLMILIAKDPNSPMLRNVEVIPTDTATAPPPVETISLEDAIKEAVTKRPEVLESTIAVKADDINVQTTRNALLPILNLSATYTGAALSGDTRFSCVPVPPATTCTPPPQIISGLGSALDSEFLGTYPEFNAQIALTIPIRNRQAQGLNIQSVLTKRQDEAKYAQNLNNIALDVHNAQILLSQDRVAVDAAIKTRELQQQTLDQEQKKLELGASTIFMIVSDQQALATAASAEVRAEVNLAEAKVNFDRAMGRTMEANNITIADSKSGHVSKDTLIPGTTSTGEIYVDHANQSPSSSRETPASNSGTRQ